MAFVNVNRSLNDQFYRYKMPKLIAKVEGKGNGIKTVIVNMSEIAKALSRPPTYPTKYFGCELGSQTQFDPKKDRYIVNGQHDATRLQDILDGFIKKYVLCPSCENPETVLTVLPKKAVITTKCKACGHSGTLVTNHKLNTFIIKNPPEGSAAKKDPKTPKKGKKKGEESPNNSAEEHENGDNNNVNSLGGGGGEDDDDEDDDWGEDTSADAVRKRMQELTAGAKVMMFDDDVEKPEQARIDIFYAFVKQRLPLSGPVVYKEIISEAERLEVKDKAGLVLCELLFDENAISVIKQHHALFRLFTNENRKAQKYLLGGLEQAIKDHKAALLPKCPALMMSLYEKIVVEEETFMEWSKKVSKKYVGKEMAQEIHEKAKPFIEWLEQASEEEESSEEDLEIEYDDRHIAPGLKEIKEDPKPSNGKALHPQNEDDDLDIDAI